MMHLKAIHLYGFKSFARETHIELASDLTALVGPNGGGKSNVVDAIRWALGEQRVRELRADHWDELLWNGSERRRAAGVAEVRLHFDNQDGAMSGWPETLEVGRRLYRQGESEYLIGTRSVRLKDVTDLFLDSGLGRAAYAIIGQGRIEAALLQRPAERLQQVEEAAGNTRVQLRQKDTRQQLAVVARDLVRARDLRVGVEREMAELAEAAARESQYLNCLTQIEELRRGIKAARRASLENQVRRLQRQRAEALCRRRELTMERERLAGEAVALASAVQDAAQALETVMATSADRERERQRWQGRLEILRAEHAKVLAWQHDAAKEQERARAGREAPSPSGGDAGAREEAVDPGDALADAEQALRAAEQRLAAAQSVLDTMRQEQERLGALATAYTRVGDRLGGMVGEHSAAPAVVLEMLRDRVRQEDEELGRLEAARNAAREQAARVNRELARARDELTRGERAFTDRQARRRALQQLEVAGDGYAAGVRAVLKAAHGGSLDGILGTLGSLLDVASRYRLAVETALGGAAQDVVVRSDGHARAAVSYLQARRLGRATFLPLGTVRASEPDARDRVVAQHPGVVGWALELVEVDPEVRPAASHRLGRVLVLESLDDALVLGRQVGFRYRLVTLDGQLVHAGGAITGGSAVPQHSVWSRRAEIDQLTEQLAADEAALAEQRAHVQRSQQAAAEKSRLLAALEQRYDGLARENGQDHDRLAAATALMSSLPTEAASAAESLQALAGQVEQAEAAWRAIRATVSTLAERRATLEAERRERLAVAAERERQAAEWARLREEALQQEEVAARRLVQLDQQSAALAAEVEAATQVLAGLDQELSRLASDEASARAAHHAAQDRLQAAQDRQRALEFAESRAQQRDQQLAVEEERARGQLEELLPDVEAAGSPSADVPAAEAALAALTRQVNELGPIRPGALAAYQALEHRARVLAAEESDVARASQDLEAALDNLSGELETRRRAAIAQLERAFATAVTEMFGGGRGGFRWVTAPEPGLDLWVEPPGKRPKTLGLLSGGEKALGALAWLFALLEVRPAPLVVLDEAEASLDEENARRFALYLARRRHSQYLVVTHHKSTMEQASVLWGFTADGHGATRLVSVRLGNLGSTDPSPNSKEVG